MTGPLNKQENEQSKQHTNVMYAIVPLRRSVAVVCSAFAKPLSQFRELLNTSDEEEEDRKRYMSTVTQ